MTKHVVGMTYNWNIFDWLIIGLLSINRPIKMMFKLYAYSKWNLTAMNNNSSYSVHQYAQTLHISQIFD